MRHFAFSICFIFTTLPWPGGLETFLIQGLMQIVAWVTVGLLNLSHIAALQHGNLIEVKTGLLGIDEACSGVRSLDRSRPASWFRFFWANFIERVFGEGPSSFWPEF
jgi:hypothetical protein